MRKRVESVPLAPAGTASGQQETAYRWVVLAAAFKFLSNVDLVAVAVTRTFELAEPAAVIVPTISGATARRIARFRLPVWSIAVSPHHGSCQALQFSYGVHAVHLAEPPDDWSAFTRGFLAGHGISGRIALLTEGPSARNPQANNRMEIIDLTPA